VTHQPAESPSADERADGHAHADRSTASNDQPVLSRRGSLRAGAGLAATAGLASLAGCFFFDSETGTATIQAKQLQIDAESFSSLSVTFSGGRITKVDDSSPKDLDVEETSLDIVGGEDSYPVELVSTSMPTNGYGGLEFDVTDLSATRSDGSSASIDAGGNGMLSYDNPFNVSEDTTTIVSAGFKVEEQESGSGFVLTGYPLGTDVDTER